ncbi:hypothetical protein ACWCQP_29095 [Streptomyces chartreusis]
MSIAEDVRALILLSDYANADAAGKANILGAGWQVTGLLPSGFTAPQTLVVLISVPPRYYGQEFAIALTLCDETGQAVQLPGPAGNLQAMRIQQIVKGDRPNLPGVLTHDKVWGHAKALVNLPNGLPLQGSHSYEWRLEIEGSTNPQWSTSFYVAGPPSGPVVG